MRLLQRLINRAGSTPLHATLIDPASTGPQEAARLARLVDEAGTDLFLLGGSTGVTGDSVGATVQAVAKAAPQPRLLFPSRHDQVAPGLDGILFTLTFNSTLPQCIVEEQARGARPLLKAGIEAVTTAYVIVEPGMTVGKVTQAELITRDDEGLERTSDYAHLAAVLGMDAIYLEAGSGAPDPVPATIIEAATEADLRVIVGGGIRTPEQAQSAVDAGADVVVTGTVAERGDHDALERIIGVVDEAKG